MWDWAGRVRVGRGGLQGQYLGLESLVLRLLMHLLESTFSCQYPVSCHEFWHTWHLNRLQEIERNIRLSRVSTAPALLVEGCTVGPTISFAAGFVGLGCVRVEEGGRGVGYLRGVALNEVFAADEAVLEAPEPIVSVV